MNVFYMTLFLLPFLQANMIDDFLRGTIPFGNKRGGGVCRNPHQECCAALARNGNFRHKLIDRRYNMCFPSEQAWSDWEARGRSDLPAGTFLISEE